MNKIQLISEIFSISANPKIEAWEDLFNRVTPKQIVELEKYYELTMGDRPIYSVGKRIIIHSPNIIEAVKECTACGGRGYTKIKIRDNQVINTRDCKVCMGNGYQ